MRLPKLIFKGTIFSGTGKGKGFINLPWVKGQIEDKLGFSPYPGTLNIYLKSGDIKKRKQLEAAEGKKVEPKTGYYSGLLFKATIDSLESAVVIPSVPNYPSNVLEIISPTYLRGQLGLVDGSTVVVVVNA